MDKDTVVLDFESQDNYISKDLGAGWAYGISCKKHDFKVLGAAVIYDDTERYITDWAELRKLILSKKVIIAHNATYEIGCLNFLFKDDKEFLSYLRTVKVRDTLLLAKLYDTTLHGYGLDALSKKYLRTVKKKNLLHDVVWNNDLYPMLKKEIAAKEKAVKANQEYVRTRPTPDKLDKFCYANMDLIQQTDLSAMAEYALEDTRLALRLHDILIKTISTDWLHRVSELVHICVKYRKRGVRVNMAKAWKAYDQLTPIIVSKAKELFDIVGEEFNPNSTKELPSIARKLGLTPPKTPLGAYSVDKKWLESQTHPFAKAVIEYKKYKKIQSDFIKSLIDMQEYTGLKDQPYGIVFPELHVFAAITGRFSSSTPNIQQIPARDKELSAICRGLFEPEEGKQWFSIDFSSQEIRLQVHYAYLLGCEGASLFRQEYINNPRLDVHQMVSDMAGIGRSQAKAINLGLSYGMGINKLASQLNVSRDEAIRLRSRYSDLCPYLDQLNKKCMEKLKNTRFIKTILGRALHLDKPVVIDGELCTFEYKALNKLIQGSAADQTIEAMIKADEAGIDVLFPVHDELCMQGTLEEAYKLAEVMKTCIKLEVPVEVDIEYGDNWGNLNVVENTQYNITDNITNR